MYDSSDLLQVPARNVGEYARNLLRILYKPEELQSSLLPSAQSKRYSKPELDRVRLTRLNGKLRISIIILSTFSVCQQDFK